MGHVYSSREMEFGHKHSTRITNILPTEQLQYALYCTPFHAIDDQSIFFEMTQRVVVILDSASDENAQVFHLIRINNRIAKTRQKIPKINIHLSRRVVSELTVTLLGTLRHRSRHRILRCCRSPSSSLCLCHCGWFDFTVFTKKRYLLLVLLQKHLSGAHTTQTKRNKTRKRRQKHLFKKNFTLIRSIVNFYLVSFAFYRTFFLFSLLACKI